MTKQDIVEAALALACEKGRRRIFFMQSRPRVLLIMTIRMDLFIDEFCRVYGKKDA